MTIGGDGAEALVAREIDGGTEVRILDWLAEEMATTETTLRFEELLLEVANVPDA